VPFCHDKSDGGRHSEGGGGQSDGGGAGGVRFGGVAPTWWCW
jgi:hypothetical protein